MADEKITLEEIERKITEWIMKDYNWTPKDLKYLTVGQLIFDWIEFSSFITKIETAFDVELGDAEGLGEMYVGELIQYVYDTLSVTY